jgi:hypothetical protein
MRISVSHAARWTKGTSVLITRLIYYSRICASSRAPALHKCVEDILIQSVANNRRDNITGALIHDRKWFAQVLEGDEAAVSETFARILRDPRHCDVRLVRMQLVSARWFSDSWMSMFARDERNADLFRHYTEGESFEPPLMSAERLGDLIEALAAGTQGQRGKPASAAGPRAA